MTQVQRKLLLTIVVIKMLALLASMPTGMESQANAIIDTHS